MSPRNFRIVFLVSVLKWCSMDSPHLPHDPKLGWTFLCVGSIFGEECIGVSILSFLPQLAVEARERPNTRDRAGRLVVATGHLSPTWYCWRGCGNIIQHPMCLPTALKDTKFIFTFADLTVCSSLSAMLTHLVVLPNYHEDEAVFREAFEHLGRAPSAEDASTKAGHISKRQLVTFPRT